MFVLKSTYQKQLDINAKVIAERDELRTKLLNAIQAGDEHINRNAGFSIDFEKMKPFSIERNRGDENRPVTIFGYFDKNEDPKEWYIYCSLERHNQLVEEFNGYKAKQEARQARIWGNTGPL